MKDSNFRLWGGLGGALLSGLSGMIITVSARAQDLNQRQIYERCSAKLVRQTADPGTDPIYRQVIAGRITGVEGCKQLLRLARFPSGTNRIANFGSGADNEAKRQLALRVIASMHDFHNSWFTAKQYESGKNACYDGITMGTTDPQTPALYLTRALFSPAHNYDSILTGNATPKAIRQVANPNKVIFNPVIDKAKGSPEITSETFTSYGGSANLTFVSNGPLEGVETWASGLTIRSPAAFEPDADSEESLPTTINGRHHSGGGILGSQAYLLNNLDDMASTLPDLEKTHRIWAKNVYQDILCRSLPVLRDSDVTGLVSTSTSALAFRKDKACVQCHASMDTMAGFIRNQRLVRTGTCQTNTGQNPWRFNQMTLIPQSWSASDNFAWPAVKTPGYRKNKPQGWLYFLNYNNQIVLKKVEGLEQLAAEIKALPDFYMCAAQRYYEYFTGIKVDLAPRTTMTCDEEFYRDQVISLGAKLRTANANFNKDPLLLVEAILSSAEFKKRDFMVSDNIKKTRVGENCQ